MIRWAALTCVAWSVLGAGCATVETDDYAVYHHAPEASALVQEPVMVLFANPEGIEFRGVASHDDSVDTANVLYSGAGGAGGVAAQIALHAAMVQGAQDRKLERLREQANLALEPLSDEVDALRSLDLATLSSADRFSVVPRRNGTEIQSIYIETHPIFYVTEDLDTLSVKNVVVLRRPGAPLDQPAYQNLVEVVSVQGADAYPEKGLKSGGLEAAVRDLYQASVLIALDDMQGRLQVEEQKAETFRHDLNGDLRLERGVTVKESCSDLLLRNLRGWLISLPKTDREMGCADVIAQTGKSRREEN